MTPEKPSDNTVAANTQKEVSLEETAIEIASDKVGAEDQILADHHIITGPCSDT